MNQELRHHISYAVQQELNDPSIGFTTITSVATSSDLRHTKVFFTCMGDEASRVKALKSLNKASGYIRKLVAKRLYIKFMPDIKFFYDDTEQQKEKIDKIFDRINKATDAPENHQKGEMP